MTLGPAYGDGGGGGAAVDTNDYIKVSESTTDTEIAAGAPPISAIVNFDTEDENTDTDNFSLASEIITVADAGEYRIEFMITFQTSTAVATQLRAGLDIDPDTTVFGLVLDSFSIVEGQADNPLTIVGFSQRTLVAASRIRLSIQRNLGSQVSNVEKLFSTMTVTRIRA